MKSKYFNELSRILRKHDIECGPVENGRLVIQMNGQPVGRIEPSGMRCVAPSDLQTAEAADTFYRAVPYVEMVAEYMDGLQRAPLLHADGLEGNFLLLAEFYGVVLAGKEMDSGYGMQFVTWRWDYNRSSVMHGNYYHDNYEGAKADFAERSGLVQKGRCFTDEQLTEMYRCMQDTLEGNYELTGKQEKLIADTCEQIDETLPDLKQRVIQAEKEMDSYRQTM